MILVHVLVAAIANWGAIETFHHGSIFERFRAWVEAHEPSFLRDLILCPFCLSHWTAAVLVLLVHHGVLQQDPSNYASLPVMWLAIVRLSNLLNDAGANICRTPNRKSDVASDLSKLQDLADDPGAPNGNPAEGGAKKDL